MSLLFLKLNMDNIYFICPIIFLFLLYKLASIKINIFIFKKDILYILKIHSNIAHKILISIKVSKLK